jgi:hypothetical protein
MEVKRREALLSQVLVSKEKTSRTHYKGVTLQEWKTANAGKGLDGVEEKKQKLV